MTITLDGTLGITTPAETVQGALTTTGNTILGDASTDTLNVGNGGLVKDASGNVGIGTASPSYPLDVQNAVTTGVGTVIGAYNTASSGSSIATLRIRTAGTGAGYWDINTGNTSSGLNRGIRFFDNIAGAERMSIDSSGNLLVGTTSVTLGALGNFVKSNSTNYMMYVENSANTSGDKTFRSVLGSNCNNTSSFHLVANTGGSDRLYIYGNGNVVNTNNSYGALSDVKLKENIVDASPKLANLMQVKVRNYNLIGETTKQIGVVAQELEQVFPSMIDESPDQDREGNDLGTTTKSVKYSVFVPMLIKAIQEQQALITQLQADVATLKALSA